MAWLGFRGSQPVALARWLMRRGRYWPILLVGVGSDD